MCKISVECQHVTHIDSELSQSDILTTDHSFFHTWLLSQSGHSSNPAKMQVPKFCNVWSQGSLRFYLSMDHMNITSFKWHGGTKRNHYPLQWLNTRCENICLKPSHRALCQFWRCNRKQISQTVLSGSNMLHYDLKSILGSVSLIDRQIFGPKL